MTDLRENNAVLNASLEALLARESAGKLIELGGTVVLTHRAGAGFEVEYSTLPL